MSRIIRPDDDVETVSNHRNHEYASLSPKSSSLESKKDRQRSWAVVLYATTTILLFADQNLLSPNLSAAALEFGFTDIERDEKLGGDIALAFFILGAPASFLVGCMADSADPSAIPRNIIFGVVVLIGEGACMATYFTTTYHGLYVTRAMTGFSVGGALPLLSSVFADFYPPEQRCVVNAYLGVGTGVGIALGQGVSGFVGPIYNSWRLPFLIIGLPAIVAAILIIVTVTDPERGGQERKLVGMDREALQDSGTRQSCETGGLDEEICNSVHSADGLELALHENLNGSLLESNKISVLEQRTNKSGERNNGVAILKLTEGMEISNPAREKMSLLDSQVGRDECHTGRRNFCERCLMMFKPSTYSQHIHTTKELLQTKSVIFALLQGAPGCVPWGIIHTYLNDYLSEDCGMTVQAATTTILVFGIGNLVGKFIGGVGGDYLYCKDPRYPSILGGSMIIFACIPLWALINMRHVEDKDGDGGGEVHVPLWMFIRTMSIAFFGGIGCAATGPIVKAALQNVTLPNARGQVFALLNLFDDFGKGLGPVFVAMLIREAGGRRSAFNIGVAGWVLCGLFNLCLYFTVKADEVRVQHLFTERFSSTIDVSDERQVGNVNNDCTSDNKAL